jgi:hypothetical protein
MSYRPIKYDRVANLAHREIFRRANMYIGDVYSMFNLPLKGNRVGGGCNFAIALMLLCVVDGIATGIYPTKALVDNQEKRFKKLLRDKLFWGPSEKGWMEIGNAAKLLYAEFRNPLVHELASDKRSSARPVGFVEPIIGKWGVLPPELRFIDRIDRLKNWDPSRPIVSVEKAPSRRTRAKLAGAALYWAVKKLVADLAAEGS